ncbi:MAG: VCBS repeat-containing protein [Opitutaceae bacterium]|nr:VCBS repeat-containing protein [Opitutaceae bacterium]
MRSLLRLPFRAAGAACVLAAASLPTAAQPVRWQLDSFRAFSEGTLPDAGADIYAAADGTVRLINAFDFNRDGRPDIFLPCNHAYGEMIDLAIYWDQPGYGLQQVSHLPTEGGKDAAVADFNRDGFLDLVVVSGYNGARNELNAYVYLGGKDGFSKDRKLLLPTQGAEAVVAADLNGDGWPEIVVANNGRTYHVAVDYTKASYIYWNDAGKFSPERRTDLPTVNGRDVAVGDLNGDGAPDLVFVSAGNEAGEAGARVFWGGRDGYAAARSLFLPGEGSTAVTLGDLDADGRPELVLVNGERLKGREGGIYNMVDTVQLDSFIYWNAATGLDPARRTGLPTVAGTDAAIADLDRDGRVDLVFANSQGDASFVYWGSPEGFLHRRRLTLPTQNARAVLAADLNRDGHVDLAFANSNAGSRFDIDSYVYWGGPTGPSAGNRQGLPTSGAAAVLTADLNNRGRNDLIFINKQDGTDAETPASLYLSDPRDPAVFAASRRIEVETIGPDGYSAADFNLDGRPDLVIPGRDGVSLYWGDDRGYRREHRTPVISNYAVSARVADFNRDGHLDLMLSEWQPGSDRTHVYYGSAGGFSTAARTALPVSGIRFHTLGDFNKDGWLDVAFPLFIEEKVVIFWNSAQGFTPDRRSELPVRSPVTLETADLNGDGYLELIVPNMYDKHPAPEKKSRSFGGSPEGDVFIFWGSAAGFSADRRDVLPGIGLADAGVADFNNDGRLDLAISSYHGGVHRQFPSYVYFQGPQGFTAENRILLPTNSASGVMTIDYNGDGWTDLLFANHHKDGSHRNDSYLYWGGPEGFSPDRRLELPAKGPHLMTVVDPGNIYDRRPQHAYVSPAKAFPAAKRLRKLAWNADTPPGTAVRLQVRSAASAAALAQAPWENAPDSGLALRGPWVQFQAILENPGGGLPVLRSVTLDFE